MKHRRPTQHIRRYRSGRWTCVNKGILYKNIDYQHPKKSDFIKGSEEGFTLPGGYDQLRKDLLLDDFNHALASLERDERYSKIIGELREKIVNNEIKSKDELYAFIARHVNYPTLSEGGLLGNEKLKGYKKGA